MVMEELKELIKAYGLEEDSEYVIIPLPDKDGRKRRCFLLKRDFIRIMYSEGQYIDYPLVDAIEATVRYPDMLLSEALNLIYSERGIDTQQLKKLSDKTNGNDKS